MHSGGSRFGANNGIVSFFRPPTRTFTVNVGPQRLLFFVRHRQATKDDHHVWFIALHDEWLFVLFSLALLILYMQRAYGAAAGGRYPGEQSGGYMDKTI